MDNKKVVVYNKLVRDLIPNVLESKGIGYEAKRLSKKDLIISMKKKIIEEIGELLAALDGEDSNQITRELADLFDLFDLVLSTYGISLSDLDSLREKLKKEKGKFDDGIFLIKTIE